MTRLLKSFAAFSFGAALAVTPAIAQQDTMSASSKSKSSAGIAASDARFVKEAADGGFAEVALGQLAVQKASSNDVKQFGQRMVDDHGKANEQLKELAAEKKIDIPREPSAKHKATQARLEKLSGDEFDKAYMADMLKDHKKDVADFRRESQSAKDPDVKNFAAQTLPTLQEHLKQAESIAPSQNTQRSSAMPSQH